MANIEVLGQLRDMEGKMEKMRLLGKGRGGDGKVGVMMLTNSLLDSDQDSKIRSEYSIPL